MSEAGIIGLGLYDRTRPLFDGRVALKKREWRFEAISSPEATRRSFVTGEIDGAEVSFSGYLNYLNSGGRDYTAIPAFISRAFRLNCIYVRADSGIDAPLRLAGKRIGLPDFDHATPIWLRGILAEQYGLDWRALHWVIGPLMQGGPFGKLPLDKAKAEFTEAGAGLWESLAKGHIDAVMTTQTPPREFATAFARLFSDPIKEEKANYRRTGIFPILHFIAVRRSLAEHDSAAILELHQGFCQGLKLALDELTDARSFLVSLPWLSMNVEQAVDDGGSAYWSYGAAENRKSLEAFCRYAQDQGYTARRYELADLFPEYLLSI